MPVLCASVSLSCLTSAARLCSCPERGPPAPRTAAGDPQGLLHKQVWAGFPGRCEGNKVDTLKGTTKALVSHLTLLPSHFPHPDTLGNGFRNTALHPSQGLPHSGFSHRRAHAYLLAKVFFLKSCIFVPSKSQKCFKFHTHYCPFWLSGQLTTP